MSDIEQRLAEALVQGAEEAPSAVGLAGAARARRRAKQRTRLAGAAALVAVSIGVPAAVVATRSPDHTGHHSGGPAVATDPTPVPGVPAGQRLESWHSASIMVPDTWGYGSLEDWCASGDSLAPRVQRPDVITNDIRCPSSTYGISFQQIDNGDDFEWPVVQQDPKAGYPDGAFVGGRGIGGVFVMVTAPTREEGLDVLATMRAIGPEGDANGCVVHVADHPATHLPEDRMAVCRYDADGLLEQSELLTHQDATAAEQALRATAPDARRGPPCRAPVTPPTTVIRMVSSSIDATVSWGGDCWSGDRTLIGDDPRLLDGATLYWALSPGWSGSLPDGVSLPSGLRTN